MVRARALAVLHVRARIGHIYNTYIFQVMAYTMVPIRLNVREMLSGRTEYAQYYTSRTATMDITQNFLYG